MGKYIKAEKLKEIFNAKGDMAVGTPKTVFYNAAKIVDTLPGADVVSMGVHQQVRWERDVAIEQLTEYGVGFGEKKKELVEVIRCGGCRYYNRRWGCRKLEINVSANDYCFMAEPAVADREVVLPDGKKENK